jgi:hypothetical protein
LVAPGTPTGNGAASLAPPGSSLPSLGTAAVAGGSTIATPTAPWRIAFSIFARNAAPALNAGSAARAAATS